MNDSGIRLVRKRFKCIKCNEYESKLVRPGSTRNPCSNCPGLLAEVNEKEYQLQKPKVNSSGIKTTKSFPVQPIKEHYKEHYETNKNDNIIRHSTKDTISNINNNTRPPSNNISKRSDNSISNKNDDYFRSSISNFANESESKNDTRPSRERYQSNDHRSNQNRRYSNHIGNNKTNTNSYNAHNNKEYSDRQIQQQEANHPNESNGFNLNNIFRNIFNQDNIGGRRGGNVNPNPNGSGVNRNRSVEPAIHLHNPHGVFVIRSSPNYMPIPFGDTFFQNFFGEQHPMNPFFQPQVFPMPFNIRVHRHNFNEEDIFDPEFNSFGSTLNGFFLDNFSSNFRSNLENEMFEQLVNAIQDNLLQAESRNTKKTKKETLNSLKKFPMTEKYCKKVKNGKLEFPNCCICLSAIGKGENTVLLPCGHMFHWKCCHSWLKDNNTCPVCRFELPAENGDKARNNL